MHSRDRENRRRLPLVEDDASHPLPPRDWTPKGRIVKVGPDDVASHRGDAPEYEGRQLPDTRAECLPGGAAHYRPCPFVSCRHHLYLESRSRNRVLLNFPAFEWDQIPETCALDAADRGPMTLYGIARRLNITRDAVRQTMESRVFVRLRDEKVVQAMHEDLGRPVTADAADPTQIRHHEAVQDARKERREQKRRAKLAAARAAREAAAESRAQVPPAPLPDAAPCLAEEEGRV